DLGFVGLGQDGHGGSGGVDSALLLGGGDALDAVPAAFVLQVLIDPLAGHAEDDLLVAAHLAGVEGDGLHRPALVAGVVVVHVVEVAGKQGGLVAAGAGADFHDQAVVILALAQEQFFQPAAQRLLALAEHGVLLLGVAFHLGVGFGAQHL